MIAAELFSKNIRSRYVKKANINTLLLKLLKKIGRMNITFKTVESNIRTERLCKL